MCIESSQLRSSWDQFFTTVHLEEGWITPLLVAIDSLEASEAFWKPADGIPSIAEVLLHVDGWLSVVVKGVRGEKSGDNEDWPDVPEASDEAWRDLHGRVSGRVQEAKAVLDGLSDAQLYEERPCDEGTRADALSDIFVHNAYHAGQIVRTRQLYAAFQAQEVASA